nr:hypothetical protein [Tanacetum cinerariifolium]
MTKRVLNLSENCLCPNACLPPINWCLLRRSKSVRNLGKQVDHMSTLGIQSIAHHYTDIKNESWDVKGPTGL